MTADNQHQPDSRGGQGECVPLADRVSPNRVYGVGEYSRDAADGCLFSFDFDEHHEVDEDDFEYHDHLPHWQEYMIDHERRRR